MSHELGSWESQHLEPSARPEKGRVVGGLFAPSVRSNIASVVNAIAEHLENGGIYFGTTHFQEPVQYFSVKPGVSSHHGTAGEIAGKLMTKCPVEILFVATK
jgi:hypothetical protein